jgi:hypothetical protein
VGVESRRERASTRVPICEVCGRERPTRGPRRRLRLEVEAAHLSSVLTGTQPVQLTTETLTKRADLPLDWEEQWSLLDFDRRL